MSEDQRNSYPDNASVDAELVRAFIGGDEAAFDRLVLKHQDMVFNLCYRMLANYEEARDCAQEVFVKVYRSLGGFKFQSGFATWLYRIAVNASMNRLSSSEFKQARHRISIDAPRETDEGEQMIELSDNTVSVLAGLEQKEREKVIRGAIDALSDEHKTIVILRDLEGLSYEEIAKITGETLGTVKSRLSRARQALTGTLKKALSHEM